jgi:general secretion pathway protein F
MSLFEYQALDVRGRRRSGLLEAEGPAQAREALSREGLFPVSLREGGGTAPAGKGVALFSSRVRRSDLAAATRQLATLLRAGLPLVSALDALVEQMEKPVVRRALAGVRDRVNQGKAFHEALTDDPAAFPLLYTQMVRAGEAGGFLDAVMLRLADTLEREERLKGKVRAALVYPALLSALSLVFLVFLFAYVVPQVVGIFSDYGRALPLPTRILLVIADFSSRWWPALLLAPGLLALLFRNLLRSERFGPLLDGAALRLPLAGRILLKASTVRLGYVLGTLLGSGVPMLYALEVASQVAGNRVLSSALRRAEEAVRRGESLAASLRMSGVFPPLLARVTAVGEKSGDLPRMLTGVAESYEEEVGNSLTAATAVLQPLVIVLMGGMVLFVMVAVLLPIFEMNSLVRG